MEKRVMSGIGDRLREVRAIFGESQKGMARRFSLGENGWQNLELGGRAPKGEILTALAEQGINLNWLMTGVGSPSALPIESPPQEVTTNDDLFEKWKEITSAAYDVVVQEGKAGKISPQRFAELVGVIFEIDRMDRARSSEVSDENGNNIVSIEKYKALMKLV